MIMIQVTIFIFIVIIIYNIKFEQFPTNKQVHFIHIPKNAGSSIKKMYSYFNKGGHHFDALPMKNKINIAVIRNPYSRFLSIFYHIKERGTRNNYTRSNDLDDFDKIDDLCKAYLDKNNKFHSKAKLLLNWTKNDFKIIENIYKKSPPYKQPNGGCTTNFKCMHWAPQYLFIQSPVKVDYLLKFEELENDLKILQNKNILEEKKIMHVNKSKYDSKKIIPLVKKIVDKIYYRDFELWNNSGLK